MILSKLTTIAKSLLTLIPNILVSFVLIAAVFCSQNSFAQIAPITTDSRIKTLVYSANEVFQLKFHYGYQSFIEFADDEETEMISIGESFAWRLTPAGKRLFIRPLEIGAHTNMTIITNKRTYQFDIASAEYDGRADEELVYTVRFYYPDIRANIPIPPSLSNPNPGAPNKGSALDPNGNRGGGGRPIVKKPLKQQFFNKPLDLDVSKSDKKLNLKYSVAGKSGNITPLKVFDDGKETYFQFKDKNLIVPTINQVDIFGSEQQVGYAIRENFVVVSGVFPQLTLRLADSLICIFNEGIVARPQNARIDFYEK
jgi:type IV secretion system protein VirB9